IIDKAIDAVSENNKPDTSEESLHSIKTHSLPTLSKSGETKSDSSSISPSKSGLNKKTKPKNKPMGNTKQTESPYGNLKPPPVRGKPEKKKTQPKDGTSAALDSVPKKTSLPPVQQRVQEQKIRSRPSSYKSDVSITSSVTSSKLANEAVASALKYGMNALGKSGQKSREGSASRRKTSAQLKPKPNGLLKATPNSIHSSRSSLTEVTSRASSPRGADDDSDVASDSSDVDAVPVNAENTNNTIGRSTIDVHESERSEKVNNNATPSLTSRTGSEMSVTSSVLANNAVSAALKFGIDQLASNNEGPFQEEESEPVEKGTNEVEDHESINVNDESKRTDNNATPSLTSRTGSAISVTSSVLANKAVSAALKHGLEQLNTITKQDSLQEEERERTRENDVQENLNLDNSTKQESVELKDDASESVKRNTTPSLTSRTGSEVSVTSSILANHAVSSALKYGLEQLNTSNTHEALEEEPTGFQGEKSKSKTGSTFLTEQDNSSQNSHHLRSKESDNTVDDFVQIEKDKPNNQTAVPTKRVATSDDITENDVINDTPKPYDEDSDPNINNKRESIKPRISIIDDNDNEININSDASNDNTPIDNNSENEKLDSLWTDSNIDLDSSLTKRPPSGRGKRPGLGRKYSTNSSLNLLSGEETDDATPKSPIPWTNRSTTPVLVMNNNNEAVVL
ncbi:unnamed protein product, partial [Owenia fusiformis]